MYFQLEKWIDPENGRSTGRIKHSGALLRAVQTLVSRAKVNAVAVVGRFPDDDLDDMDDYRQGMVCISFDLDSSFPVL